MPSQLHAADPSAPHLSTVGTTISLNGVASWGTGAGAAAPAASAAAPPSPPLPSPSSPLSAVVLGASQGRQAAVTGSKRRSNTLKPSGMAGESTAASPGDAPGDAPLPGYRTSTPGPKSKPPLEESTGLSALGSTRRASSARRKRSKFDRPAPSQAPPIDQTSAKRNAPSRDARGRASGCGFCDTERREASSV